MQDPYEESLACLMVWAAQYEVLHGVSVHSCWVVVSYVEKALDGFLVGYTDTFYSMVQRSESGPVVQVVVVGVHFLCCSHRNCLVANVLKRVRKKGMLGIEAGTENSEDIAVVVDLVVG